MLVLLVFIGLLVPTQPSPQEAEYEAVLRAVQTEFPGSLLSVPNRPLSYLRNPSPFTGNDSLTLDPLWLDVPPPQAPPSAVAPAAQTDTSLFAAVVRAVDWSPDRPLHVDPRPLNGGGTVLEPSIEALAPLAPEAVRARASTLQRMGLPETDAIADMRCATGNMRVQIDSAGASPTVPRGPCKGRQPIQSVIASLPSAAEPDGEAGTGASGEWVVRVFEISVSPRFGSYAAVDYRFARDPATGGWRLGRKSPVFFAG